MLQTRAQRYALLKNGGYALLLLALFLLQSSRGTALRLWGASANALPFFVAAVALLEGPYAGGCFGFVCGGLLALNGTGLEGLTSLYLVLFGVLFGLFGEEYLRPVIPSALAGGLLCMGIQAVFRYVFVYLLVYSAGPGYALRQFCGELLLSLPLGVGVWFVVRLIHRRFTEETL